MSVLDRKAKLYELQPVNSAMETILIELLRMNIPVEYSKADEITLMSHLSISPDNGLLRAVFLVQWNDEEGSWSIHEQRYKVSEIGAESIHIRPDEFQSIPSRQYLIDRMKAWMNHEMKEGLLKAR